MHVLPPPNPSCTRDEQAETIARDVAEMLKPHVRCVIAIRGTAHLDTDGQSYSRADVIFIPRRCSKQRQIGAYALTGSISTAWPSMEVWLADAQNVVKRRLRPQSPP